MPLAVWTKAVPQILYGGPMPRLRHGDMLVGSHPLPRAHGRTLVQPTLNDALSAVDTTWVIVAAVFVMFMQAGFLLLEIGFSRQKNAGTIVPKVLANFSICGLCYWAVGFALAFGGSGALWG